MNNNVAADNPDELATLQKRANQLAGEMARSSLLLTEFQAWLARLAMPPAFPGAELDLSDEP